MSVPPPTGKAYRFNPPPNWPTPPQGWTPPPGWAPPPSWPPPPYGWQFWAEPLLTIDTWQDTGSARLVGPALDQPGVATSRSRGMLRWAIIGGGVVVGLVIANATGGILGHVFALIVWAAAAWSCVQPARARTASAARTWARFGVAAFACLGIYAGGLAAVGAASSNGASSSSPPSGLTQDGPLDVGCKMTGTPGYTSYGAVITIWNPGSSPQSLSEFVIDWGSNGVLLSQDPAEVSAEIAPVTAYTETLSAPASATSCVFAGWNP